MKLWILLAIAGVLLLWALVRERFEATPSIQAPPYDDQAKLRIFGVARTASQQVLLDKAKQQVTVPESDPTYQEKLKIAAGGIVAPVVGEFFTMVFKPATTPIRDSDVASFMSSRTSDIKAIEEEVLKAYFVGQQGIGTSERTGYADILARMGQNPGYLVDSANNASGPPPMCPPGTIMDENNRCVGSSTEPFTCPEGYEVSGVECKRIDGTGTAPPTCPPGLTFSTEVGACQAEGASPTCPGGFEFKDGRCVAKPSTTTGTTTGGSSTSSYGPTSGVPTGRNRQVFGPVFTSMAAPVDGGNGSRDSSKSNVYPELLGGMPDTSTRIPGAGIVAPSKNWQMTRDGTLPPDSSLGTSEAARFFPFSRQPGDMDIIPDPYRVAKTFSQASYSSKTEPVPFLTDFSAFLK